jgi:hypothetical protein
MKNFNVHELPICKSCRNTGRKSVKRKAINISVIDYIVCPECKNYEAFYKTTEKMKDKKDGIVINLNGQQI